MNILIFEAYTDANVGSCALVENAISELRSRFPQASIKVMAHRPEYFNKLYKIETFVDIFEYPFLKPKFSQYLWLLKTMLWMVSCWIVAPFLEPGKHIAKIMPFQNKLLPFLWADLTISVGAERINDKYYKNILFSLYTYSLVKRLKKKLILFPSTIGPFIFIWSKFLAKRVLRKIDLIYTRDQLSAEITEGLIGADSGNICKTIDLAILQEWIPRREALQMIPANMTDKIVGISAMRWSYFRNSIETPFSNYEAYLNEMTCLADTLVDIYRVKIVFYPTNFNMHGCRENDLATALEIRERMKRSQEVIVVDKLPTPAQLKGMLACSEVNITTRMHACILSTGSGTPTISINYLFKIREYMSSLGLSDFSKDIEEFNAEWALKAFARIWPERKQLRKAILSAIKIKTEELSIALDRMYDII